MDDEGGPSNGAGGRGTAADRISASARPDVDRGTEGLHAGYPRLWPRCRRAFSSKEYDVGAGDWVAGGVRRAVSGVAGLLPGSGAAEQEPEPAAQDSPGRTTAHAQVAAEATEAGAASARRAHKPKAAPAPGAVPAPTTVPGSEPEASVATQPAERAPVTSRAGRSDQGHPPADAEVAGHGAASTAAVSPWTPEELAGFQQTLDDEIARLRAELDMGEADLADLVADSGDGAGDDQADSGSKTFEREQEMSVNANTRDLIDQALRARARLDKGTYGICERCGNPIAIGRLRAAPRATLCITCKQAEERR
jgi:DnaK suppressor protein